MGRSSGTQAERPLRHDEGPALVPVASQAGRSGDADDILAAMAAALAKKNPGSTAEALHTLRVAYPHHPLALRLAALALAMKRSPAGDDIAFAGPR
jgi:hypothetical protein